MAYKKSLYRSDDAMIAGICGGLAEYFDIDATLVRIIAVTLVLIGLGTPVLAYVIAIFVIPKRPVGQPEYVDVKPGAPRTQAAAAGAAAAAGVAAGGAVAGAHVQGAAACASAPGACYTTSNSQAFDALRPEMVNSDRQAREQKRAEREVRRLAEGHSGLGKGVIIGFLLVGVGILALLGRFIDITIWRFWPLVLLVAGIAILFSPGKEGWKLERAGHGVSLITVGIVLQAWMLDVFSGSTFLRLLINLWPILLVLLGLTVISNGLRQSAYKLLGSLLFSLTLLLGVWCYGEIEAPVYLQGIGNGEISVPIPSSPDFANIHSDAENAVLELFAMHLP